MAAPASIRNRTHCRLLPPRKSNSAQMAMTISAIAVAVPNVLRHQSLQSRVLLLQLLQLTSHLRIHPAVLRPPAIVRLLADPQLLTDFGNLHSLAQQDVCLPENPHNLLPTVSFLHTESFPALWAGWILSHSLVQFSGRGSVGANQPMRFSQLLEAVEPLP